MTVRIVTSHCEDFDICAETVDPSKSPYAERVPDYLAKMTAFYEQLGVCSAIWTTPEAERQECRDIWKPVEYELVVDKRRVLAYVDESSWSAYLDGKQEDFTFSKTPTQYKMTSILISPPIRASEVKARRRYRYTNGPGHYELVEEVRFGKETPFVCQRETSGDITMANGLHRA